MDDAFLPKRGCRAVPQNMIKKFEQLSLWQETLRHNNITSEYLQCVEHPSKKCTGVRNYQSLKNFFMRYNRLKRKIINFRDRNILKASKSLRSGKNSNMNSINYKTILTNPNVTDSLPLRRRKRFSKSISAMKDGRMNNIPLGPLLELLRKPSLEMIKDTKVKRSVEDVKDADTKGLLQPKSFHLCPQKLNSAWRNILVREQQQHRMQHLPKTVRTWKTVQPNWIDTQTKKSRKLKRRSSPMKENKIHIIDNYVQLKLISQSKSIENSSTIPLPESCEVMFYLPYSTKRYKICEEFSDIGLNTAYPKTLDDDEYKAFLERFNDKIQAQISSSRKLRIIKRSGVSAAPSQPKSKQRNSSSALQYVKDNMKKLKSLKTIAKLFLLSLNSKLNRKSNSSNFSLWTSLLPNMNNTSGITLKNNFDLKKSQVRMVSGNRLNSSPENKEPNGN